MVVYVNTSLAGYNIHGRSITYMTCHGIYGRSIIDLAGYGIHNRSVTYMTWYSTPGRSMTHLADFDLPDMSNIHTTGCDIQTCL